MLASTVLSVQLVL